MANSGFSISRYLRKNHLTILGCIFAALSVPFVPKLFNLSTSEVNIEEKAAEPKKSAKSSKFENIKDPQKTHPNLTPNKNPVVADNTVSAAMIPVTLQHPYSTPKTEISSHTDTLDSPVKKEDTKVIIVYETAVIRIIGNNNGVIIMKSTHTFPFKGLNISGSNANKTVYVPFGQHVQIVVKGSNNAVRAEDDLIELISMDEYGSNNELKPYKPKK